MKYKLFGIFILLVYWITPTFAQKRGSVWCFGDSALVDFNDTSNITTGTSILKSRGSCASISDTSGNLLFYAGYDNDVYINGGGAFINGEIISRNHMTMANGDSINLSLWYRELVISDNPANSNQYYVFSIEVTSPTSPMGFFYSIVDMSLNGGLGEVIQKNVQLENFKTVDCLSAVKHGNGRDWWVVFRRFDAVSNPNNDYNIYLVSPSGISSQPIQSVGSQNPTNSGRISFNSQGTKMAFINYVGLIELYDFDRCTGLISNPFTIQPESAQAPWPSNWSSEFSPSGELMYVSQIAAFPPDSCYLIQFDLNATNISLSADTIWKTPYFENMGQLKLAPDGKIYLTTNFGGGYPYSDSTYNYINMNLSIINSPDSLGSACDLQPFSFYLGGKRTYYGLPNNPDYDLPALAGSPCDTLVGIGEAPQIQQAALNVFYHTAWEKAFINASNLKGKNGKLFVYDMQGKVIHAEPLRIQNGYYTRDLSMMGYAKGMYLFSIQTEKERLTKKVMID